MIHIINAQHKRIHSIFFNRILNVKHKIVYVSRDDYVNAIVADFATFFDLSHVALCLLKLSILSSDKNILKMKNEYIKNKLSNSHINLSNNNIYLAKRELLRKRILSNKGYLNYNLTPKNNKATVLLFNGSDSLLISYKISSLHFINLNSIFHLNRSLVRKSIIK